MEHRRLGNTDMDVSVLGFGGAEIGYEGATAATVEQLLNSALDAGLNVIDTEGHDLEVLRQVDFARIKPLLLMFEHQHLSRSDKAAAYGLLQANRYACRETREGDAIAWRT